MRIPAVSLLDQDQLTTGKGLACMLHEGFGNQGVMGEAVVVIS